MKNSKKRAPTKIDTGKQFGKGATLSGKVEHKRADPSGKGAKVGGGKKRK